MGGKKTPADPTPSGLCVITDILLPMNGRLTVLYVGDPSTDGIVEEALAGEATVVRVNPGNSLARTTDEPVACAVVGPVEDGKVLDQFGSPPIVTLVDDERSATEALGADVTAVASSDEPPELLRAWIEHGVDRPGANAAGHVDRSA